MPETKRVSGLQDMLSCHHRPNGKRIQVPVGDIFQVGGGEGRLSKPSPCLQYLTDRAVATEQQGSSNSPNFMSPDP